MSDPLDYFAALQPSGDAVAEVERFLAPRQPDTWRHVLAVAEVAESLAARFGLDQSPTRLAALSHDLAAVVPRVALIPTALAWGVPLSPVDREIPQVLHGPIAAAVLVRRLQVVDSGVLSAVRYHTTLRPAAAPLDLVIFVADKIAYDPTTPRVEYLSAVQAGLERSLEAAAYAYLDFVVTHQAELGWRLHPWLVGAQEELREEASGEEREAQA